MNSQDFRNTILQKKPRYANSRIPILEAFANKGKSKSDYSQFGPIYELYIYAFTLGLKKGLKLPLPTRKLTTDFVEIAKWKGGSSLVDFLLMIIFSHSEEIGFKWEDLEDLEEKELNNAINDIISFIESYANGGLEYLQQEFDDNKLMNSPYLFVDLLAENSEFRSNSNDDEVSLETLEPTEALIHSTKKIIEKGESTSVEFKSTMRINMHTDKKDPEMEHECIKTIAAFMNSNGGTLLIGVDDKKTVLGLEKDFNSFGENHDLLDKFQTELDNLIENQISNSIYPLLKLSFPNIDEKTICRLDVAFKKSGPIYSKNKAKKNLEEFYIRRAASSKPLNASEINDYIKDHWNV